MSLHRMMAAAAVALTLAGPAVACEYLTEHFDLCSEGTAWADGVWEQGGDSATLHLGNNSYDGFEDYIGHDNGKTIGSQLNALTAGWQESGTVDRHSRDKLKTPDLSIVRSIDTITFGDAKPTLRVSMIAVNHNDRILLMVKAPADTPLESIDKLSRDFASLIRPKPAQEN